MSWSEAEANFAKTLPGYEPRKEQRRLAETIERSLANVDILMAQAGTGTGKSLAAMTPAIQRAVEKGTTAIISTATKALQTQYATKDVPFLLENLGIPFKAAVLKGRSNYACLQKISELKPGEVEGLEAITAELDEDHSGDLDDIVAPVDQRFRSKLTATSDECPGKKDCPFGHVCFAEKAKAKAKAAQIVIVNHAMLAADLKMREKVGHGVLPDFDDVLIDEAHELEEYTTGALGSEFGQRGLTNAAAEAANFMGSEHGKDQVAALNGAAAKLFKTMEKFLGQEKTRALGERHVVAHQDVLIGVLEAAKALQTVIGRTDVTGDDKKAQRRKRLGKRFGAMADRFEEILLTDEGDLVRWVEKDEKRGVLLKFAPLHVGPFLANNLWSYRTEDGRQVKRSSVLLSATLAFGDDFGYIADRLGVRGYKAFDAGTPFDYPNQAALYVPENCDPTDKGTWEMQVGISLTKMVRAAGGRSLLLFTSTSAMKRAYEAVAPALEDDDLQVLIQGGELTNKQLAAAFKSDETSVLFALKSFMTGFDVQGDALRLVVMDKLPFAVPTDVIWKARCDAVDAKKTGWLNSSFNLMTVPSMALILEQAFGRLIRTKTDEGLVAIMDSRLHTKRSYGPKIMKALPPASRVKTLDAATRYLEDLTARRS